MKNKVYYGEYTLRHWMNLMIRRNIVLPEYQRTFVWDKSKVQGFFDTLNKDYFIPPITIGYLRKSEGANLIIDGQQRLTSLLLGYLGIYPNHKHWSSNDRIGFADDNDDDVEDTDYVLGWTYEELTSKNKGNTLDELKKTYAVYDQTCDNKQYDRLNLSFDLSEDFLNEHYLGFSYLVPCDENVQKYYSYTFKNINTTGVSLLPLESRKSMYFLEENLDGFFDPHFLSRILVENGKRVERIDFVRYLSLAFQQKKTNSFSTLAKNYGKRMEEYYSEFINAVVNEEETALFSKCDAENRDRIGLLKDTIEKLGFLSYKFKSIIDVDIYMYGLVYYIVVDKRRINVEDNNNFRNRLETTISKIKENERHKRAQLP